MFSLPTDAPNVKDAMAACISAFSDVPEPGTMCRQCICEEMERRIKSAAQVVKTSEFPPVEDFAQIYYEHPNCVGGEDTLKLFLPSALQKVLTGRAPPGFGVLGPETLETLLRAGFWFWDPARLAPVRALAVGLFWDWFGKGCFELEGWSAEEETLRFTGPGDAILELCCSVFIDPVALTEELHRLHTPWADDALSFSPYYAPRAPFYLSVETGLKDGPYMQAAQAIAQSLLAREAQAYRQMISPGWLKAAFFRHADERPDLAKDLSNMELNYDVYMIDVDKTASAPILRDWPDLPVI